MLLKTVEQPDIPDVLGATVIENPTNAEDVTFFFTPRAITVSNLWAVVRGTTPSVTWTIRYAATRNVAGTEVIPSGTATTSEAGVNISSFTNDDIPADSWVWIETTVQTGTVLELALVLEAS